MESTQPTISSTSKKIDKINSDYLGKIEEIIKDAETPSCHKILAIQGLANQAIEFANNAVTVFSRYAVDFPTKSELMIDSTTSFEESRASQV